MTDADLPHAWSGGLSEPVWIEMCAALTALRRGRIHASADRAALLDAAWQVGTESLVRAALGDAPTEEAAAHAARVQGTLTLAHDLLRAAGIAHAFWKGAFFDVTLWGARGLRSGDDVDVLVSATDYERARTAICARGFVPAPLEGRRATERTAKAWAYLPLDQAARVPIDLHRRPLNDPPFSSTSEDVLAFARSWQTALGPLPGAAPTQAVPWIAGNLAGGRFQGIQRLAADAACLWEAGVDEDALIHQARAWRAESATWGLLSLLAARFEVAIPARVLDALAPAAPVARLVERAFGAVGAPVMPASKAEAILLMDWPLANRAGWLVEKTGHALALKAQNRVADLVRRVEQKIHSHPPAVLGNLLSSRLSSRGARMPVSVSSKVVVPPEVLVQEIDGESVLLDLRSEKYFGLDESGTALFTALKDTGSVAGAIEAGLAAFEVERDVLTADVIELVESLAAEGLVVVEV